MTSIQMTDEFLKNAGMHPDCVDIDRFRQLFIADMHEGLRGTSSSLQMIPTYLTADGHPAEGETAVAVDIGGTNLRVALTRVIGGQLTMLESTVSPVPGLKEELSKDEFIQQIAEKVLPVIGKSDRVGVCFSHVAEILPNKDGRLVTFSKEIKVKDAAGMEICRDLRAQLIKMGVGDEKRFVLLNDTVAVLFGGMTSPEANNSCADIGLVLGTGMNIGYREQTAQIGKLRADYGSTNMLVNIEAGCFDKLPLGTFDRALDARTANPLDHLLEKMTSGAYLGTLICTVVQNGGKNGLLSEGCHDAFDELETIALADAGAFLENGSGFLAKLCLSDDDRHVLHTIIDRLVERAAKLIASAIIAVIDQIGAGATPERPMLIAAEGSTFHKLYSVKGWFERYLSDNLPNCPYKMVEADNATLLGTGYAALLNT